ncbi:N-formylglutamate amidohydrolase [Pararhizobium mangrovi]|uniref:N-formylglutamate amidohydrolase n=1 Tax=Pararhizobium mangrovi TaxID=2590452 RepID=A0A506TZD2_9HYPH|nr:N-formylglutamate amidohydrolase [Pararhizobium mangrovi]TPW26666.1 N-formylglutamate amidohydrolase [Pararhizobium mangrovi]
MSEFAPYEILDAEPGSGIVLLADHARAALPERYAKLGLPEEAFTRHIAYDIGVEALTRRLGERLSAPAVLCCFSRLLIDPNRGEDDPTLVMKLSDGAVVPANHPMTGEERAFRLETFHRPYHRAVADLVERAEKAAGAPPFVVSLHSFTPAWKGEARPWHVGVLWDSDPRAPRPLIEALQAEGDLVVGDNEPYSGALGNDTMFTHCTRTGLAHALIEVRQDLIADNAGVAEWADRLCPLLESLNARPEMHRREYHGSRTGLL